MFIHLFPSICRLVFATLLALFLTGCATQQVPIGSDVASKITRVAVISVTAKSFTRQYTGLTVFGNEFEEADISDWKIDEQYEEQIRKELRRGYGFTVVEASYPVSEFARVNDLNGPWDAPAFWGPNWSSIESSTKSYCKNNSLDAVLVLAKSKTGDFLARTNQSFGGVGIYSRGPMQKVSVMHLVSKIALIECTTAKPLAIRLLAKRQDGLPGQIIQSVPLIFRDFNESRIPMHQWSPEYKNRIQSEVSTLPGEAIEVTLKSIFPTNNSF